MRPYYSQSSRENATRSSGTSPLASFKEVPPPQGKFPKATTLNVKVEWSLMGDGH